uniref:Kazal-like domain-containing protein n=1 Tax=Glossina austeni TaxID=7395 RepID=A0A1A9UJF5_GLOAU
MGLSLDQMFTTYSCLMFATVISVVYAHHTDKDCNTLRLCKADKLQPTCGLDKDRLCFQRFPSPCVMQQHQCLFNRTYINYHLSYCFIDQFICEEFLWLKDEYNTYGKNDDVFGYDEKPQENVEIILQSSSDEDVNNFKKSNEGE